VNGTMAAARRGDSDCLSVDSNEWPDVSTITKRPLAAFQQHRRRAALEFNFTRPYQVEASDWLW